MNDSVRERIVRNNYTFPEANEQIRSRADEYDAPIERIPFLCECPVQSCTEVLRMTMAQYSDVQAHPDHFFTVPGHEQADGAVSHVVSREEGYVVVEKEQGVPEQ